MERDELRLECVRVAASTWPGNHDEAMKRARAYFEFITEPEVKSAGNAEALSSSVGMTAGK